MGIQINGQTDTITAIDGGLNVSGADLGSASAGSLNVTGIVTASGFSGNITGNLTGNVNASGVSTVTDLRVGTAVTANSDGIQVGAGKSIRIFGSASGYSNLVASSAAGASELLLPSTGGTIDRLNRAGNILQVVSATYSTVVSTGSLIFIDTGLTASITPSSTSSKILVLVSQNGLAKSSANAGSAIQLKLLRNSTQIGYSDYVGWTGTAMGMYPGGVSFSCLDSPSAITSVTYKTQFANPQDANFVYVQVASSTSNITLMEVAA